MIAFFMVFNIMYGVVLMNFHLEIIEDMEELGLASFFLQSFRISLGDFVNDNFAISGAKPFTLFSFYIVWLAFVIMQLIVICNFMIAIVSDVFETDYSDVVFFH